MRRSAVLCTGELMWDLRGDAKLEAASHFERVPGGAAANVASALCELGVTSAVTGTISDDVLGRAYAQSLMARGIDVSALQVRRGRMGVVFMDDEQFVSYRPRFERWPKRLSWPALWRRQIPSGAVVFIAALSADTPELGAQVELVRRARKRGASICLDINARPRAWRKTKRLPRSAKSLLALADVVKASRDDLAVLDVAGDEHAARAALGIAGTLVLTRGKGTTVALGDWGRVAKRPPRVQATRHIGAGDAFCAALLRALTNEPERDRRFWAAALQEANTYAAIHVSG